MAAVIANIGRRVCFQHAGMAARRGRRALSAVVEEPLMSIDDDPTLMITSNGKRHRTVPSVADALVPPEAHPAWPVRPRAVAARCSRRVALRDHFKSRKRSCSVREHSESVVGSGATQIWADTRAWQSQGRHIMATARAPSPSLRPCLLFDPCWWLMNRTARHTLPRRRRRMCRFSG
jgi:hypothetical protein